MSKLYKLVVLITALSLAPYGAVIAEPVQDFEAIPITVGITTVSELTVLVKNIVGDAVAGLSFSAAGVTTGNPWRVSDQYLDVEYSCNVASWGIRIITDNITDLVSIAGYVGVAGDTIACGELYDADTDGDGVNDSYGDGPDADLLPDIPNNPASWGDGDDILAYSGLINTGEVVKPLDTQNPKMRASLGWQIYANKLAAKPPNPAIDDVSGAYNGPWAYLADKSDNVTLTNGTRKMNGANPAELGDELIVTGETAGGELVYNYTLLAYGGIGQALAQHPALDPKEADDTDTDGKLDVIVYLAAKFANTDYSDPANPKDFVLPGGSYQSTIYVELIHQ